MLIMFKQMLKLESSHRGIRKAKFHALYAVVIFLSNQIAICQQKL